MRHTYLTYKRGKALARIAKKLAELYDLQALDSAAIALSLHDNLASLRNQLGQHGPSGNCEAACPAARANPQHAHTQPDITLGMGPGEAPLAFQRSLEGQE